MGALGRDPSFFTYVTDSVPEHILRRVEYALTTLDPSENPYLHWILKGHHDDALLFSLREENVPLIRKNLDCLDF